MQFATLQIIRRHRFESRNRNLGNFDMHEMISRLAHDPGVGKLICAKAFLGPRLLLGLTPRPFPEMGEESN